MLVGIIQRRIPEREDCVADIFVDGRFMAEQQIRHGREKGDQESDDFIGQKLFRYTRKAADIAEEHSHFALFPAQFQLPRVFGDAPHQFRREVAIKCVVYIRALLFLLIIDEDSAQHIDRNQPEDRPGWIDQELVAAKRDPAAAADGEHSSAAQQRTVSCAQSRQQKDKANSKNK